MQDKTPADIQMPGTPEYIGGYIFERFPRLLAVELGRRPDEEQVLRALSAAGFALIDSRRIVETHRVYVSFAELASTLRLRTGRSIVHELSDAELDALMAYVAERVPQTSPIVERVPWTLWWGRKPTK